MQQSNNGGRQGKNTQKLLSNEPPLQFFDKKKKSSQHDQSPVVNLIRNEIMSAGTPQTAQVPQSRNNQAGL